MGKNGLNLPEPYSVFALAKGGFAVEMRVSVTADPVIVGRYQDEHDANIAAITMNGAFHQGWLAALFQFTNTISAYATDASMQDSTTAGHLVNESANEKRQLRQYHIGRSDAFVATRAWAHKIESEMLG